MSPFSGTGRQRLGKLAKFNAVISFCRFHAPLCLFQQQTEEIMYTFESSTFFEVSGLPKRRRNTQQLLLVFFIVFCNCQDDENVRAEGESSPNFHCVGSMLFFKVSSQGRNHPLLACMPLVKLICNDLCRIILLPLTWKKPSSISCTGGSWLN